MKAHVSIFLLFFLFSGKVFSDTTDHVLPKLTITGYADIYYAYDFGRPSEHERPAFIYNYKRHNEINLNLGYLKLGYQTEKLRANFSIMAGTYPQYNLAAEQGLLKNILEANAGIKLLSKTNIWLEAGIFSSHIGFESAISKDCWSLTRSIMAENTPYYLSGAKLTYLSNNSKWTFSGLIINGWQRIQRVNGNNTPAFGTQLIFKPTKKLTLNSSTFIGNDKPDSLKQMRYFHDLYGIFQLTKKIGLIAALDIGIEQKSKGSHQYNLWYNPMSILRYTFTEKIATAARYEYYFDDKGVIINSGTPHGFQTSGYSLNIDYAPVSNFIIRIEGRMFNSKDKLFRKMNQLSNQNYSIVSSIAISF